MRLCFYWTPILWASITESCRWTSLPVQCTGQGEGEINGVLSQQSLKLKWDIVGQPGMLYLENNSLVHALFSLVSITFLDRLGLICFMLLEGCLRSCVKAVACNPANPLRCGITHRKVAYWWWGIKARASIKHTLGKLCRQSWFKLFKAVKL